MSNIDPTRGSNYPADLIVRSVGTEQAASDLLTARQHLTGLEVESALLDRARKAVFAVTSFIEITQPDNETQEASLIDFFSIDQILEMEQLLYSYLGIDDVETFLANPTQPTGYSMYIEKLSGHFALSTGDITSSFSDFERRHSDPSANARGPMEANSRNYAIEANSRMLRQFKDYYQLTIDISLRGPSKLDEGGVIVWERGVSECQFLLLDYIRDTFAKGIEQGNSYPPTANTMTPHDIEASIANLLRNRTKIIKYVSAINPLLAEQIEHAIDDLSLHTYPVLYRGRVGAPRYVREPRRAEHAINVVANLLAIANQLEQIEDRQQEDVPILDI